MSAPGIRPPAAVAAQALTKAARRLEQLRGRRRKLLTKLRQLDDDIRQAARILRDVAADVTAPQPGEQLTVDDAPIRDAEHADPEAEP